MRYKFKDATICKKDVYFASRHRTIHCLMKIKNYITSSEQIFRKRKGELNYLSRKISKNQITEAIWF